MNKVAYNLNYDFQFSNFLTYDLRLNGCVFEYDIKFPGFLYDFYNNPFLKTVDFKTFLKDLKL